MTPIKFDASRVRHMFSKPHLSNEKPLKGMLRVKRTNVLSAPQSKLKQPRLQPGLEFRSLTPRLSSWLTQRWSNSRHHCQGSYLQDVGKYRRTSLITMRR